MNTLSLKAHAKVNLFLRVGRKREDGYHDLASVFQTIDLCDRITLSERNEGIVVISSVEGIPPEDNLCTRAARALLQSGGGRRGAGIRLEKAIPIRAGLGGGSADAAATLLGLNHLWGLELPLAALTEIAASLGSDVPFFLQGGTALATGRGEVISPLGTAPSLDFVLVKPEAGVATAEAYARLDALREGDLPRTAAPEALLAALAGGNRREIAENLLNDFSVVAGSLNPDIMNVKQELLAAGCLGAQVCGSGSAVFGIAARREEAEAIRDSLRRRWPWVVCAASCERGVEFLSKEEEAIG